MNNFFTIIFIFIIFLIVILFETIYQKNNLIKEEFNYILNDQSNIDNDINYKKLDNLTKCMVPNLTTDQCYKSRYYECPVVNGTYLQCTNNYIPKPNEYNADCGNRTFEMVPYPWKISENCYYNKIGFNRDEEFGKVKFN